MLTAKTDYTYIDWSASDMSDADVRGIIMPTEDARNKQHGLRKEDFAYMLEAIYQIRYAGTFQTQLMTTITPSVDSQSRLKTNFKYLQGYIHGDEFLTMMCVQDGNIYETAWRNIGRVTLIEDGIAQFVPSNKLIDFSTLDIQPDENKIDDELMTRMYSILGQSMVYNVPQSYKSYNFGDPPMLGVWSFSGTMHDEIYKEDGTKDSIRSTTTQFTTNKPGGGNTLFGVAIQQPVYPTAGYSMLRTYSMKSDGTYFMSGKRYMTNTSLTLAVPSGTTDCWVYVISHDVYGSNSQPYTARMIEASVNAAGDRATISGFGSDADVNAFISLGNYSSPVQSGNWQLSIGAVFCKVNAKWHWW